MWYFIEVLGEIELLDVWVELVGEFDLGVICFVDGSDYVGVVMFMWF